MSDILTHTLRQSVVRVLTVIKEPDQTKPWESGTQHHFGGSACVIQGHRLLTNAHVVSNHLFVQVAKHDDSKKYIARVLHVDHDRELALLTVDDATFFTGTMPVSFGGVPAQNSRISVFGFPIGGNELCITTGVVSRMEVRTYVHSQRFLLALQTDAAMNSGNSGGPAFMDGLLVGIVFQAYRQNDLQRSGYVVPIPIIRHFFTDLEDDYVSGVPDLGVYWQKFENKALRDYYRLNDNESGLLVSRVVVGSSADGFILENDIIEAIDGVRLNCDGSALVDGLRVHFTALISRRQIGEAVTVAVLRQGARISTKLTLKALVSMIPARPGQPPTYFMFAGLVMLPLTFEYMAARGFENAHFRYKHYYYDQFPSQEQREVVILSKILTHEINLGYQHMYGVVVRRINGIAIKEMSDVVPAFASPCGEFHVVEIDNWGVRAESSDYNSAYGCRVVIDVREAARATAEILAQHGMAADRSANLR